MTGVRRTLWLLVLAGCADTGPSDVKREVVEAVAPPPVPIVRASEDRVGSQVALARRGDATLAYVADEDATAIRIVDVTAQHELGTFLLPGKPAQLVVLADGRIAASIRDRNEVLVLAGTGLGDAPFAIDRRVAVASEPIGLALTRDDATLLVASGAGHTLTAIGVRDAEVTATWDLADEPRAVLVADDNQRAFVSHAVGGALDVVDLASPEVARIPLAGGEWMAGKHQIPFIVPRRPCQGFALAASKAPTGRIFAPDVLAFSGGDQVSTGYGSTEVTPEIFDVAVVDEDRGTPIGGNVVEDGSRPKPLATSRVLHSFEGATCALPRAAAASSSGSLFVTCLGADQVFELDGAQVAPESAVVRSWTVASGPTGIAVDDPSHRVVVWSQFAQTLTSIELAPGSVHALKLGNHVDRGRELFHATADGRISGDGRACASCHPDGRQDTLVWSTPLGPRQTPMLAGRLANSAPYGWNGDARDIADHLRRTFKNLHGTGLTGDDLHALIAYVQALPPPVRVAPAEPAVVADGKRLFDALACSACHGDDGHTPDGARHDVGSKSEIDTRRAFDTPSLAFVGETAPYYHDGRYRTLRELLIESAGYMTPRKLSPPELDALATYLATL